MEPGSRYLQKPGPEVRPSCRAAWHSRPAVGTVSGFRLLQLREEAAGETGGLARATKAIPEANQGSVGHRLP